MKKIVYFSEGNVGCWIISGGRFGEMELGRKNETKANKR
jgi:hypothetical protein